MGARPAWALLALTCRRPMRPGLRIRARFCALASAHKVALVGGDTTRGPCCIRVQLLGHMPPGSALRRAARACRRRAVRLGHHRRCGRRTCSSAGPTRRHRRRRATSCASASVLPARALRSAWRCAATRALHRRLGRAPGRCGQACAGERLRGGGQTSRRCRSRLRCCAPWARSAARRLRLTGGEDYELCFTVARGRASWSIWRRTCRRSAGPTRRIGRLPRRLSGRCVTRDRTVMEFSHSGYHHSAELRSRRRASCPVGSVGSREAYQSSPAR